MSKDLREYSRQTQSRLIAGFFILLFLLGDGLIMFFYGKEAAVVGILCMFTALIPLVLIWIFLGVVGKIVKRAEGNDEEG